MLKKAIWFIVMLGMSGFMYFGPEGGGGEDTPTPTDASPTSTMVYTATINPTEKTTYTPTATATKIPTVVNTATTIPTNTQIPTKTKTPLPTNTSTPAPTLSATVVPPTATSTLQNFLYSLQPSTPIYLTNFVHQSEGCNWQGVAGQVFDTAGKPVSNLVVKVTGKLGDRKVSEIAVTGMVDGLPYGPGSFEVFLGSIPVYSNNTVQIQIFDSNQNALSAPIRFITRKACDKTLTLINFIQK